MRKLSVGSESAEDKLPVDGKRSLSRLPSAPAQLLAPPGCSFVPHDQKNISSTSCRVAKARTENLA